MPEPASCPECGAALPPDAPRGFCPRCLLRLALDAGVTVPPVAEMTVSFGPGDGDMLAALAETLGGIPRVLLRDTEPEPGPPPVERPDSPELPLPGDRPAKYQLFGEIARGGMGAVLKAHDPALGRELALKVLLERHKDEPELVRRFLEEAQIGGQLQHPGIVPVYDLGAFADRRPFFAMKLVKGRTLAALLAERPVPSGDLPKFLGVFEQVCQTMAYAHARGVIHRDLKPSNVMVGSFGEVQVMDWGLAKVLPRGGATDEFPPPTADTESVVQTTRSGSDASRAGSVMGTPAYMPPEQARGEAGRIDERADVFALGSILCEVLTGRPAYVGGSAAGVLGKAAAADLADATGRLDSSGADAELVTLARSCLAPAVEGRPRDARAVAEAVTSYLAGVQDRLKAAELARVEAQARAEEERKRRKLAVALAASLLLTAGLGAGGWAYLAARQAGVDREVERAYADASSALGRARGSGGDPAAWSAAGAGADALGRMLEATPVRRDLTDRVARLRSEARGEAAVVAAATEADRHDRALLSALVAARSARTEVGHAATVDAMARAFAAYGLSPSDGAVDALARRIEARPPAIRRAAAAGLDEWAILARPLAPGSDAWRSPLALAEAIDPEPSRLALRRSWAARDTAALLRIAAPEAIDRLEPTAIVLLASALAEPGPRHDLNAAIAALRRGLLRHPRDAQIHFALASDLARRDPAGRAEAIPHYLVAFALEPATGHEFAHLLADRGRSEEAEAIFEELAALEVSAPDRVRNLSCFGELLRERGNADRAREILGRAVAAGRQLTSGALDERTDLSLGAALYRTGDLAGAVRANREAIRRGPGDPTPYINLALALRGSGDLAGAIATLREAIRLKPDALAYTNLGTSLSESGNVRAGIEAEREAIRLKPDYAVAHANLAIDLFRSGENRAAIDSFREAIRLKPDLAPAHHYLGIALQESGDLAGAVASYREAIRLRPHYSEAHSSLGSALGDLGDFPAALGAHREAIRLQPLLAPIRLDHGNTLRASGDLASATEAYREAIRLDPQSPQAHVKLAQALGAQNRMAEALAALRRGHELGSKQPGWRYPTAEWLREAERQAALAERLPAVLKGGDRPKNAAEGLALALMAYQSGHYAAAARLFADALAADPMLADDRRTQHRYNAACAAALAGAGRGKDDPPPDEAAKAKLRRQALDWLRAERAAWTRLLESGPPRARPAIAQRLQHWRRDTDLAGIRDPDALGKLHEEERKAWRELWADVEALRKKAEGDRP
jgi:tetratricopeptide (TPR) repeat protein